MGDFVSAAEGRDEATGIGRRGLGLAAAATGVAVAARTVPAQAQTVTDADILNFTLNFEYLGSEFYLHALFGTGLAGSDITGVGTQGTVSAGGPTPFRSAAIAQYAQRFAVDELGHVRFIRSILGSAAIAEPTINLSTAWTTLAIAAGLIQPGQTFSPYNDDVSFLLGAYVLEDVCVTALAGAAALLTDPNNIEGAAGLLGVEAYQAGTIRTLLANLGAGAATDAISALRASLSGVGDQGTSIPGLAYNAVNADTQSLAFRRTPAQILQIAYGGRVNGNGFFPNFVNGNIR